MYNEMRVCSKLAGCTEKALILGSFLFVLLTSCVKTSTPESKQPRGTLFIIGGGSRDSSLMEQLINVSGWQPGDWISIAPMSSRWDSAYISMNLEFQHYTRSNIRCIRIDSNTVKSSLTLDSMRKSKIIYLNGGDQSIFMMHIKGTDFKKAIKEAYDKGATVAGTSAGAALMSERMLTGNQLKDKEYTSAIPVIWRNNVEVVEGLGLLDSVMIDQHFIVRSRNNRLISAVLDNQKLVGIGIDESTAIIVQGDTATVVGDSQVMVYQRPNQVRYSGENLIGAKDMLFSIHLPGDKFRIRR
jgi:cyanophycinase